MNPAHCQARALEVQALPLKIARGHQHSYLLPEALRFILARSELTGHVVSVVKVFKLKDIKPTQTPNGTTIRFVDKKIGARKIGVLMNTLKPGKGTPYHYHRKRESFYIVQKGRAKAILDGEEFILEPETVVLIPAGTKHGVINIGNSDYKFIEIISSPGIEDFVVVPHRK